MEAAVAPKARKILSDAAALREARRRWGKGGYVKRELCGLFKPNKNGNVYCSGVGAGGGHGKGCPGGRVYMAVGRIMGVAGVAFFSVLGQGTTWAEAFEKAEGKPW